MFRAILNLFLGEEARIARVVIVQFFVTIALPVAVLLGIPLLIASVSIDLDPRLWQALIAGLVITTGWLTTAIFNELARTRTKSERLRDYHKAIYAEIGTTLASLWDEGRSEAYAAATVARMRDEADFVPFIPRESHDHIYDAILDEIDVLPRQTIDIIVAYYSLIKSISALADDMRGERFLTLPKERQIAVYEDYSEMRRQAFAFGQHALALILAFASGGAEAAQALKDQVNTPAVDRSGP
ncbi:hypothetical protein [Flavimaricola marinus]|uniref:Uncharacterized protein n=1 Tax=Flavimaricola marinus TaxID=1819565 RepID=A0A238LFY7_9RHOB|nr:hypothetical protein [Flavimaricola marinus]SMY08528.1 hypothetical protein LOM8899_02681 [Flavimaricola marinus]